MKLMKENSPFRSLGKPFLSETSRYFLPLCRVCCCAPLSSFRSSIFQIKGPSEGSFWYGFLSFSERFFRRPFIHSRSVYNSASDTARTTDTSTAVDHFHMVVFLQRGFPLGLTPLLPVRGSLIGTDDDSSASAERGMDSALALTQENAVFSSHLKQ